MRRYGIHDLVHSYFHTGMHRDGIRAMFWGVALRTFAATSVGLFVPIYVYTIGIDQFGGTVVSGLRILILFLLIARLSIVAHSFVVEHIIDRIGFRWTLLLSSIALLVKYLLLTFADSSIVFLWIAAVVSGTVTTTYWISRHALFGEDQDVTHVGSSLGLLVVLSRLATIIGPIVGGLIASFFGFHWLFALGLVLAILSAIPYFFMHHHHRHHPDGVAGLLDKILDPKNFPLIIGWLGRSWDDTLNVDFLPLYIFIVLGGVGQLGAMWSLVAVVAMIVGYISGRMFDKTEHRKRIFVIGSGLTALTWPMMALARGFGSLFFLNSAHTLVGSFYSIPFLSQVYRFSFRRDTVAFFVFREIIWSVGVLVLLLFVFLMTFSWSWTLLFILGGLGVFISINLISYQGFQ